MSAAGPRQRGVVSIERFLGAGAASGGPFALLGLTPGACEGSEVTAALDRQIARIDGHPQGDSTDADDVRLALHAAAAQLLDAAVRGQMMARWAGVGARVARPEVGDTGGSVGAVPGGGKVGGKAGAEEAQRPRVLGVESESAAFGRSVLEDAVPGTGRTAASPSVGETSGGSDARAIQAAQRVLAASGGWNDVSRQRLLMYASARGIPAGAIPEIVRRALAGRVGGGAASAATTGTVSLGRPGVPAARVAGVAGAMARGSVMGSGGPASFVSTSATGGDPGVRGGGVAGERAALDAFDARMDDAAEEQASRTMKRALVWSLVGIGVMASAFWAVVVATTPGGGRGSAAEGGASGGASVGGSGSLIGQTPEPEYPEALFPTGGGDGASAAGGSGRSEAAPARASIDAAALLDEFRVAARAQAVDPEAARASLRGLLLRAGAVWPDIPLDRRRAIVDTIVEFVYQSAGTSDGPVAVLEEVSAGASLLGGSATLTEEDVARASWSVGLLVRLQRERDISARAGSLIEARLGSALQGARPAGASALDGGIAAALSVMPRRLIPSSAESTRTREGVEQRVRAWRRWLECVQAVTTTDPGSRATLILGALDTLVHDAAQPTDDRQVFESMGVLVGALDWSEGGVARSWLVGLLGAPSVSSADVHAITNAVATQASGAGLDVSLVLAARATDLERRELRDRLLILWNLADAADQDALSSAWREALAEGLERHASDLTAVEHLGSAIVLSRVSEAAALRWRGLTQEADDLLLDVAGPVDGVLSAGAAGAMPVFTGSAGDGIWAEQYLLAGRSIPIRIDLLRTLSQSLAGGIGPVDAEVLVEEAVRGSPAQVARAAYDMLAVVASNPNVVGALLEELPNLPKTRRNSALIALVTGESLPTTRDPRWESRARRALVGRMLQLLAADSDLRIWDELSGLLGWSYLSRAEALSGPANPGGVVDPPEVGAGLLRSRWRRQAETLLPPAALGLTLDEIDRRRAARLELAKGPAQTFAAEQLAGIELMALVVSAEQPQRVEEVRAVLSDLASARQRAGHIAEQIAAGEAAGASLWAIRLKEGTP